jgi:hypothetical protein
MRGAPVIAAKASVCFDEALFLAGIADRGPGCIQAGCQRAFSTCFNRQDAIT